MHEVAGLAHHLGAAGVIVEQPVDQLEAPARGERLAGAAQQCDVGVRVAVDHSPDVGELAVHRRADGVEPRSVEGDPQHRVGGAVEGQVGELGIAVAHGLIVVAPASAGRCGRGVGRAQIGTSIWGQSMKAAVLREQPGELFIEDLTIDHPGRR